MGGKPYVVVVGGANMDIAGRPTGPLVPRDSNLGTVRLSAGGVGRNIAHNLALLGTDVRLVTAFGDDTQAASLQATCRAAGIDTSASLVVPGGATSTYLYVTDETGEMQVAINDMAILEELTPERLAERAELLAGAAICLFDTNLTAETIRWIVGHVEAPLFCDPISTAKAVRVAGVLGQLHTLKPNKLQLEALTGIAVDDEASLCAATEALLATGLEHAFVSLGADGVLCAGCGGMERLPIASGVVRDTTGAGDAMMAGLVWAELHGLGFVEAGRVGLAASSIVCEVEGAVNPALSEQELLARL